MPQVNISFETDPALLEKLTRTGLLDDPALWFRDRMNYSEDVVDYLRVLRHDISSDLTVIIGYTQFLQRETVGTLNDQQKHFLATIYAASQRMGHLLHDLTDVEILQAGEAQFRATYILFHKIVEDSLRTMSADFQRKNQRVEMHLPDTLLMVIGSAYWYERLMEKLLHNAQRFAPEGGLIEIAAQVIDHDRLHVQIADNGAGIPPEHLGSVFEKHYRIRNEQNLSERGYGLGLTIARYIVQGCGGDIWIESQPDQGTVVHFILPLAKEML